MEKALTFDARDTARLRSRAAGYGALVIGSEFCAGLLPSPAEAAALRKEFGGKIVLATPLLTDDALARVKKLLKIVSAGGPAEVIANDLGLLEVLRRARSRVEISCGRILAHRVKIMPEAYAREFLRRYGVKRFEIDDPAAVKRLAQFGLPFSWHYPYRYVTVTRFCPWENRWADGCAGSCRGRARKLVSPRVPKPLWLRGAAYFVKAQRPNKAADRTVFTPAAMKNET
jgi:hypothetical protein